MTPVDRIRRRDTPILSGPVAEQPILKTVDSNTAASANGSTNTRKSTSKKGKTSKKIKGGKKVKRTKTVKKKSKSTRESKNPAPATHTPARGEDASNTEQPPGPSPVEEPPTGKTLRYEPHTAAGAAPVATSDKEVKPACKKAAAKKPAEPAPILQECKLEKKTPAVEPQLKLKPPPTPPTVREDTARQASMQANMQRASTSEQLANASPVPGNHVASSPPAPLSSPVPPSENGSPFTQTPNTPCHDASGTASSNPGTTPAKKKKREKTAEEKAAHARYMRFSRNVKSIFG